MTRRRALAGAAALSLLAAGCSATKSGSAEGPAPGTAATAATAPETTPPTVPSAASPTAAKLVVERADNRLGVPVFSDPTGGALRRHEPARIPWGRAVLVACYAPNESGMSSVNVFYKLSGDPWDGDYAPANTFDNGAGMGPNAVDLDPRVSPCPPSALRAPATATDFGFGGGAGINVLRPAA